MGVLGHLTRESFPAHFYTCRFPLSSFSPPPPPHYREIARCFYDGRVDCCACTKHTSVDRGPVGPCTHASCHADSSSKP